jgi:hypothetical protein
MTLSLALATSLALAAFPAFAQSARHGRRGRAAPVKVLRYAFPVAETGFDPAQITDLYSRTVTANIFESPLTYDYLARPARIKPQTAAAMPEISSDFRRFVFRIRPGIHFADDPAFKGQRRELVAADYVYSIKRYYDPQYKSPSLFLFENAKVLGLSELRRRAIADRTALPLRHRGRPACARWTATPSRWCWPKPAPRFHYYFADRRGDGRGGARGGRGLSRQGDGAPGGHRPLRADAVETQLEDRAGAQPRLSRSALRRGRNGRQRAGARSRRGWRDGACR